MFLFSETTLSIVCSDCGSPSFSMTGYTMYGNTYILYSQLVYVRDSDNVRKVFKCSANGAWETVSNTAIGK